MCCSKFILFASNAIIFVLGVVVVALASVTISRGSEYGSLLLEGIVTLPALILVLGLIVCLIGFLGCFGALKESKCMLYTYAGIILVLFIGEIALAILVIAHPEFTRKALAELLESEYEMYGGPDKALTKSIDSMQVDLACCGVYNYKDWKKGSSIEFKYWTDEGKAPWSCCSTSPSHGNCDLPVVVTGSSVINEVGCLDAVIDRFKDITLILGISGVVLAIFMFFSMSTACGLARKHP